jgi:hypothetical protein
VSRTWDEPEWRARARAHRDRVRKWTRPHRRRRLGESHPVLDFLFTYYSLRPGQLERWHPGPDVLLTGDTAEFDPRLGYRRTPAGVRLDPTALPGNRRASARFVLALLRASGTRATRLDCFGLHEWAMLYRDGDVRRHKGLPLRLNPTGTDAVVESLPLRCTHYDAFRFFTRDAVPRNASVPSRDGRVDTDQPGCLHVTMDLYKWAYKLSPATPSELLADCFELAVEARELDMRASPYDLSALGYPAVRVETPAGRAEYARSQARLARRATPLRGRLLGVAEAVLGG